MRIFRAFLIMVSAVILFLLPITTLVYDFRTDLETDTFSVTTAIGETSANTTLLVAIYGNDTDTISYTSNVTETPSVSAYDTATRQLTTASLTANVTRSLVVSYNIDAINNDSVATLLDNTSAIWLLMVITLPVAAIASIFLGKD